MTETHIDFTVRRIVLKNAVFKAIGNQQLVSRYQMMPRFCNECRSVILLRNRRIACRRLIYPRDKSNDFSFIGISGHSAIGMKEQVNH